MIKEMLQGVGVDKDDVVLLHSDITPLKNHLKYETYTDACEFLYWGMTNNTSAWVVPTFNYDFSTRGKHYKHEGTPSQVGVFTNYCLFQKKMHRTFHPVFSFIVGGEALLVHLITNDVSKDAFGDGSVFDRLYDLNAKIVMLSVPATKMTFCHYVEQRMNVWYRYKKYFTGLVTKDGQTWIDTFSLFVRDFDREVHTVLEPVVDRWEKCGIIKRYEVTPDLYMLSVSTQDLFNALRCELVQNANAIIQYKELE